MVGVHKKSHKDLDPGKLESIQYHPAKKKILEVLFVKRPPINENVLHYYKL